MAKLSDLSLCTYSCRSIKNSVYDVQKLCAKYDIIFLQEHWLLSCELNTLSNIDTEFLAFGVSAMNITSNVIKSRPYGGTALLYCKVFVPAVEVIDCEDPRLCAFTIKHVKVLSYLLMYICQPTLVMIILLINTLIHV